jgi:putative glutamine amidotransferase
VKPLVGISCCSMQFGVFGMPKHAASDTYVRATDQVVGAVPVLIPANGEMADIETLLMRLDGIILTGSRSNVDPSRYGGPPHRCGTPEDASRDAVTLRLVRGMPRARPRTRCATPSPCR